MGCGASSAVQIAPISDTDLMATTGNNNNNNPTGDDIAIKIRTDTNNIKAQALNGYPPKTGFKFTLFATNKVQAVTRPPIGVSAAVQTDCTVGSDWVRCQSTQTDIQFATEDELDLMLTDMSELCTIGDDTDVGGDSGGGTGAGTSDSTATNGADDVNKSVLLQTEDSLLNNNNNRKTNANSRTAAATQRRSPYVTIDVGVQVRPHRYASATQTLVTFATAATRNKLVPKLFATGDSSAVGSSVSRKSSAKLRNAVSTVDIESHYRLWTTGAAPAVTTPGSGGSGGERTVITPTDNINSLNLIPYKKHILHDTSNILQDFESQTDPLLSTILAANSAGNDLTVLQSYDITSPFAHIEKELLQTSKNSCHKNRVPDNRLQDSLSRYLDDMDDALQYRVSSVPKCDASVQTDNDILTDESPEFAARPPPCLKREMITSTNMFREIDRRVADTPEYETLQELVENICKYTKNDLFKVRAIFRWITINIKFDWKYMGVNMSSEEILKCGEGVCKDYCQLFADMCRLAGIRVKKIEGFAKGQDYRPGHQFKPGEDITHTWNAVFLMSAWRLIDTTWGTGYTEPSGRFQRKLNEHFFLTDPEVLIWTHFPYNDMEDNYCRWQLLDKWVALDEFNALPKVSPTFFDFNLKIRSKPQNPIVFRISTEVKIGSHEAMRYKYKLYPSDEMENSSLNHYVFCQLKEDRLVGSFAVQPPIEGRFFLKIFAKPERDMNEGQDSTSLQNVCTLLMECTRARKYIEPLPINELPWGPTQTFYDYKLRLHNQTGPVIVTWGGRRRLVMESNETMLISYTIYDADGMEMDTRSIVSRDDSGNKTTFTISPPRVGTFKLMIFGMPKPKQKGKWRLPLLASFMVDCKLIKPPQYDEDPPPLSLVVPQQPPDDQQRTAKRY